MKKLSLTLTLITFLALSFSSCSGLQRVSGVQSASFTPDYVRVEANINDYEVLGETTVTLESRTYLGFINKIDKIKSELKEKTINNNYELNINYQKYTYYNFISYAFFIETYTGGHIPNMIYLLSFLTKKITSLLI